MLGLLFIQGIGGVALLIVAVAMTAYSGSLSLQMLGVRVRRSVSQVIVTLLAFGLILWLYAADTAARFQDVVLLVSYWIPGFAAVVLIDWTIRTRGGATIDPAEEPLTGATRWPR